MEEFFSLSGNKYVLSFTLAGFDLGSMWCSLQLWSGSLLLRFVAKWGFGEAIPFLALMNIFLAQSLISSFLVLLG